MPDPSHSGSATATPVPTTIILTPSYWVPVGVAIVGLGLGLFTPWLGVLVFVFAVFLAVQATILRLHFTAMELYRQGQLLRQFPYSDWLNWQIFWTPVPILFYFREVKSIHFVPIVFDPAALKACLALRCPLT
jgi:hypothetical protein